MAAKYRVALPSPRITPPEVFFKRRAFLSAMGLGMLSVPLWASHAAVQPPGAPKLLEPPLQRPTVFPARRNPAYAVPDEPREPQRPLRMGEIAR